MKYTIELTEAEREVICNVIRTVRDNSLGEQRLFENTTIFKLDEESSTYSEAYNKGFEAGKEHAIDETTKTHQLCYDNGYNNAIEDLSHAMKVYFPLNTKERLDYFGINTYVDNYAIMNPKDLIAKAKDYEEKKNTIECGDEVTILESGITGVVLAIKGDGYEILSSDAKWNKLLENQIEKTGRNLKDDVLQLLSKLKGEVADDNNKIS